MRRLSLFFCLSLACAAQTLSPVVGKDRSVQVHAGENLYELGLRYGLAIEHFAFANGLPVQLAVNSGRELKVPARRVLPVDPPEDGLVVNLPERGVFLFRHGAFDKFYPVAIGQPGRFATPTGHYTLASRVKDPTWFPPEWAGMGKDTVVEAGPDNPLGDRWMGLDTGGLGLHSTTQPTSIGSAASHGCMRMYPQSARELFEKVEVGFPVRIEYEPVKLGRDAESGSLCISIFPDVYQQMPLLERAQQLLDEAGLRPWVDEASLENWVRNPKGTPQTFADGLIGLRVANQEVGEPGLLLKTSSGLWTSVEALRRMGVQVSYDPNSKAVTCNYKEVTQLFSSDQMVLLDGKSYLPLRTTLTALGVTFQWDGPSKTLVVD